MQIKFSATEAAKGHINGEKLGCFGAKGALTAMWLN